MSKGEPIGRPRDLNEAAEQVIQELAPLPPEVRSLVTLWMTSDRRVTLDDGCRAVGISHRTMGRHFHGAALPDPRTTFRVCRLLAAAFFLIFERRSVEQTALHVGFGRPATMRHYLKRYFGRLPSSLRAGGGESWRGLLLALPNVVRRLALSLLVAIVFGPGFVAQDLSRAQPVLTSQVTAATLERLAVPTYWFLRRYLERRPPVPLTLRHVDPLSAETLGFHSIAPVRDARVVSVGLPGGHAVDHDERVRVALSAAVVSTHQSVTLCPFRDIYCCFLCH